MKEKELDQIKKKAKNIIKNNNIEVLNGEKDLIMQLNKIANEDNENIDYELINTILDYIDTYMKYKEKMLLSKEDHQYLNHLAKEFKEQTIRRTDGVLYIPLFKVENKDGKERYFLTRKSAKQYIEINKKWVKGNIIEIEESDNTDLIKVIEIIKRNF